MSPKSSSSILLALFLALMISATTDSFNEELIKSKLTETLSNQDLLKSKIIEDKNRIAGAPVANAPQVDDAAAGFFKSASAPHSDFQDYEEIYPPKASPSEASGCSSQVASSILSFGMVIRFITFLVAL